MASSAKSVLFLVVGLAVAAALAMGGYMYFKDTKPPLITLSPATGPVGAKTILTLTVEDVSGLRRVRVVAVQGSKRSLLAERGKTSGDQKITLDLSETKFKDGPLRMEVSATDSSFHRLGQGNEISSSFELILDTKAPRIFMESMAHNLTRGGSGLVAYRLDEKAETSGIKVGERFFPGYLQPSGIWACLFAMPYDVEPADFAPRLTATDMAGNESSRGFNHHVNDRQFPHDVIRIPDSFLNNKMPQYEADFPAPMTAFERFLKVNRELRVKNRRDMYVLGRETTPSFSWTKRFLRLPGSATRAGFGDQRTYYYNGEEIDHQTHLGVDLASVRAAPVPAANTGQVVFTGFRGIYGNAVIIDHGQGLMTLYSHLSEIAVAKGDKVARGDVIGRTGATGLAGGDHLHFGVYVSGLPVNPLEWWDATWIRNNITSKLEAGQ